MKCHIFLTVLAIARTAFSLTVLDTTNTNIIDSFVCKHLNLQAIAKINADIVQEKQLQSQCEHQVNQTIGQCEECMRKCGVQTSVPMPVIQDSGSGSALEGILNTLTHDPIGHFVHGAASVIQDLGHGIDHVAHEISHGIHHIGHEIHHIFGKRATDCITQCPVCNKVQNQTSQAVTLAVCGTSYVSKVHAIEAQIPKFRQIATEIQSRHVVQKVEYDPATISNSGGAVTIGTVYLTANIKGSAHRFRGSAPYHLTNTESSSTQWATQILNMFLA